MVTELNIVGHCVVSKYSSYPISILQLIQVFNGVPPSLTFHFPKVLAKKKEVKGETKIHGMSYRRSTAFTAVKIRLRSLANGP